MQIKIAISKIFELFTFYKTKLINSQSFWIQTRIVPNLSEPQGNAVHKEFIFLFFLFLIRINNDLINTKKFTYLKYHLEKSKTTH